MGKLRHVPCPMGARRRRVPGAPSPDARVCVCGDDTEARSCAPGSRGGELPREPRSARPRPSQCAPTRTLSAPPGRGSERIATRRHGNAPRKPDWRRTPVGPLFLACPPRQPTSNFHLPQDNAAMTPPAPSLGLPVGTSTHVRARARANGKVYVHSGKCSSKPGTLRGLVCLGK